MDIPVYMKLRNRNVLFNLNGTSKSEQTREQRNDLNLQEHCNLPRKGNHTDNDNDSDDNIDVVLIHHSRDPVAIIDLTGDETN